MNKATKTENMPIEMIDPNEDCRYTERVEITSAFISAKYKNITHKAKFTNAVKNVKTLEIGYIEIDEEIFDSKKDNESVSVFLFLKNNKDVRIFEKKSFLKSVLKIVTNFTEIVG